MSNRKFYLLERIDDPDYDESMGFVVLAFTAKAARAFASRASDDEGPEVWLEPLRTTCVELHVNGPVGVVLKSFNAS